MRNIDFGRFIPMVVTGFRFAQSILLLQARVSKLETTVSALEISNRLLIDALAALAEHK
jgi:hypothetical protein